MPSDRAPAVGPNCRRPVDAFLDPDVLVESRPDSVFDQTAASDLATMSLTVARAFSSTRGVAFEGAPAS
jgi:hypothetical protein